MPQQPTNDRRKDQWTSKAYQGAASFVPQLTTKVLQYLEPQATDTIIDIGCGDGVLDAKIAPLCKHLIGLDSSASFIQAANENVRTHQPNTEFFEVDCTCLSPEACKTQDADVLSLLKESHYDKAFSNAAMHWILRDPDIRPPFFADVHRLLKPGGKFVFEMGGFQNVPEVHVALQAVLRFKYGVSQERLKAADPWFFPSVQLMQMTLEGAGFEVEVVESEHRPTRLTEEGADGSGGLEGWLQLMGATFLELLDASDRDEAVQSMCEVLQPAVTKVEDGGQWLSYVRLRAVARRNG